MRITSRLFVPTLLLFIPAFLTCADDTRARTPSELFTATLQKVVGLVEPAPGSGPQTFSTRFDIVKAEGLPKELSGQSAVLAFQAPDRLTLSAEYKGKTYAAGRDRQELWIHVPDKKFGVVGRPDQPRFASAPDKKDSTKLGPFKLPLPREQIALLPLLMKIEAQPEEEIEKAPCHVLNVTPKPEAIDALKIPGGTLKLWIRDRDDLPVRLGYADGKGINVEVQLRDVQFSVPWPAERWKIPARADDKIETTALGHMSRFASVILSGLNQKIPPLGPANGERRVLAASGKGRLELHDGTRVLFLEGTPEEMGSQHGALLKKEIEDLVNRIVYGVGVGSSFAKGRWFFGEIEEAEGRIHPFIDPRYLAEMDAIALATGHEKEEIRLANFFPELFHCSGFALFGDATVGGKMYHGRILDYLRGMGLEQNAVVIVSKPDKGNAWVNVSYAGFIGSVTAMNDKHVAIGEMGGRGEGNWDGKPMAQLVREVMEKAGTLDEAVAIMRKGPRTCEYYYVISDAKTKTAVGIAATPTTFELVKPGEANPRLPHAIKDAVLMSAGDRYEELAKRVQAGHGKFTADSARDLMTRPVCMNSNIHSVLFDPETLDFWVANADSNSPASHTRYTKYNLAELLKRAPAETSAVAN
jgi:isopenicillin-N N-acyltransferase like protein